MEAGMPHWVAVGLWIAGAIISGMTIWGIFVSPIYNVWVQKKQGEADLEQAHYEQQIQVAQAKSRVNAATLNKQAEIIDAEARAASIKIVGSGLKNNPGYLQWQWIEMLDQREKGADVIYVPTEANLPIMEAGRRSSSHQKRKG